MQRGGGGLASQNRPNESLLLYYVQSFCIGSTDRNMYFKRHLVSHAVTAVLLANWHIITLI